MLALLAGGVVAAPIAAWLVRHADASVLGVVVGTLLLVTNTRTLMLEVGVPGPVRLPVLLAIAAAGAMVAVGCAASTALRRGRRWCLCSRGPAPVRAAAGPHRSRQPAGRRSGEASVPLGRAEARVRCPCLRLGRRNLPRRGLRPWPSPLPSPAAGRA